MASPAKEYVWHHEPEKKGIVGSLDENGTVTFAVEAGEGSSIRGTTYFNEMMRFFGDDAKRIHGLWLKASPDRVSTNIDKVNELTALNIPLEVAVMETWTFTRARKLGFGRIRVLGLPVGSPGAFTRIEVLIEKEEAGES